MKPSPTWTGSTRCRPVASRAALPWALTTASTLLAVVIVWNGAQGAAAALLGLAAIVIPALGVASSYWARQRALARSRRAELTR